MTPRAPSPEQLARWGVDPGWSRRVDVRHRDGELRGWHVLDTGPPATAALPTIVCVHGNPTWSAMWASFLHEMGADRRVVAPDQLGMGYSDRPASPRSFAERVADLDDLVAALDLSEPIVLAAHDWGGAIAMGWAVDHSDRVAAMVLANTGTAVPARRRAPGIIRLAATRGVHDLATRRTPLFVRGTGWLSRSRLTTSQRAALAAPYRHRRDRRAIGDFVADIPFAPAHPSWDAIDSVAGRLGGLDVPVLLAWGGRDPVFDDDFAADLLGRFARADLHRWPTAGHLVVVESTNDLVPGPCVAEVAAAWLASTADTPPNPAQIDTESPETAPGGPGRHRVDLDRGSGVDSGVDSGWQEGWRPVWAALDERSSDDAIAFHDGTSGRSVSFADLHRQVDAMARRLGEEGIGRGDRVALLVPPSPELVALVYACWRIGAVTVIADRGLGLGGLGRAVRGAHVRAVVGVRRAVVAARSLRWAPAAVSIDVASLLDTGDADADATADDGADGHRGLPTPPGPQDLAAVLFTSGATGPAKGVRYTHERLARQRDALTARYRIGPDDRFVAAFAPFALYGPALGITSGVPDVDVTSPGRLTAGALDAACAAIGATMVFASPAALANVVRTVDGPLPALATVRTVMSAGAPVPARTLRAMSELAPAASLFTPYGMTEVLPVADIELAEIEDSSAHGGRGVCVGPPVDQCEVTIAPLGFDTASGVVAVDGPGVTGEVLVRSPWMSAGYDGLWLGERDARPRDALGREWHRSGDVGHLDERGRLWIEGRAVHVIHTADGPVTPVPLEVAVETLEDVSRSAAVGVGPIGVQQLVIVVESLPVRGTGAAARARRLVTDQSTVELAGVELTEAVRSVVAPRPVAAVLTCAALPVDIRHNAKIDRADVAQRAAALLAGES